MGELGYTLEAIADGWSVQPGLVAALVATAVLYLVGVRRRTRPWPVARTLAWITGLLVLWVALASGAGVRADQLLSAHMVQHMLLVLIAPPLLAAGAPLTLALGALPTEPRRTLARFLAGPTVRWATWPPVAVAVLAAVTIGTHVPAFYDLAVRSPVVHVVEHGLYVGSAMLFWLPLVGGEPLPHRPSPALRMLWMLLAMPPMAIVGVTLLSTGDPLYDSYLGPARALGGSALADQQLAGTIMWIGGKLVLAAAVLAIGWAALIGEERRQQARDAYAEAAR